MHQLIKKRSINTNYFYLIILLTFLTILQRYFLFDITQWREDQATTYWISYVNKISEINVGLISSRLIPNPNGLILYTKLFSFIPSFKLSILFYSFSQILMIYYLFRFLDIKNRLTKILIFFSIVSSFYTSVSSLEIWAQFFFLSFNFVCLGFIFYSLKYKTVKILDLLMLCLLTPSFYLGGFLNTLVFTLIFSFFIITKKIKVSFKLPKSFYDYCKFIFTIFLFYFVWVSYLSTVDLNSFQNRLESTQQATSFIDVFKTLVFLNIDEIFTLHSDFSIYSSLTFLIYRFLNLSNKIIFLSFLLLLLLIFVISRGNIKNNFVQIKVLYSFIFLSTSISPLIGGENFFIKERTDVQLQFFPLTLLMIFLMIDSISKNKILRNIFNSCLFGYIFLNLIFSLNIYKDYLDYDGNLLSNSDVPLIYKYDVVEEINNTAISKDLEVVSIYYDLGGTEMGWVEKFGYNYYPYYEYPFTYGRIFDLLLLKEHNLVNAQEGNKLRSVKSADFVLTYKYHTKFDTKELKRYTTKEINRLRLFTVDK